MNVNHLGNFACIRILKDSGSQRNFVSDRIFNKLDLKAIKEGVNIQIHGFNCVKTLITKIVILPITINDSHFSIEAVVIPSIDIRIAIPNLDKKVAGFKAKGYTLADEKLYKSSYEIRDFDAIMGPEAEQLLNASVKFFGINSKSHYFQSNLGVLLSGSAFSMLQNLDWLPLMAISSRDSLPCREVEPEEVNTFINVNAIKCVNVHNDGITTSEIESATNETLNACSDLILNYDKTEVNDGV